MRWKENKKDKENEIRYRTIFLFFPKKINGEFRWLEKAEIEQKFIFQGWRDWNWLN
jgi:hypothetical protein